MYYVTRWGVLKIMDINNVSGKNTVERIYKMIGVVLIIIGVAMVSCLFFYHELRVDEISNPGKTDAAGKLYEKKALEVEVTPPEVIEKQNRDALIGEEKRMEKQRIEESKKSSDEYKEFLKKSLEGIKTQKPYE